MVTCSVHNCQSGRTSQLKKLKAAGIKKSLSKFSLPKDENIRQIWLETLHISLKIAEAKHVKICELHFQKSDIIRHYTIKLKDGTIYKMERDKAKLHPEALPLSKPRKDTRFSTYPGKNNFDLQEDNSDQDDDNFECIDEKAHLQIPAIDNGMDIVPNKSDYKTSEWEHSYCASNKILALPKSPECNGSGLDHTSFADTDMVTNLPQYNGTALEYSSVSSNTSKAAAEYTVKLAESRVQEDEDSAGTEVLKYKFDIKSFKLPEHWSYHIQRDGSTKLNYVHPIRQILYLSCIIHSNMSVEVITLNRRIRRTSNVTFSSDKDVINYLLKLQQWKCCEGLDVKDAFSNECQGFVTSNRYTSYRCRPCLNQKREIVKKECMYLNNLQTSQAKVKKLQSLLNQVLLLKKKVGMRNNSEKNTE